MQRVPLVYDIKSTNIVRAKPEKVFAHFTSKQILPLSFAEQYSDPEKPG